MKKSHSPKYIWQLLCLAVGVTLFTACSESDEEAGEFDNWQSRNDTYFANIYNTAKSDTVTYKIIRQWSLLDGVDVNVYDHIVAEVLNEGTGSGCPLYTDSVRVHYEGRLMPSTSYPGGYVFDKSWTGEYNLATNSPATFAVNSVVDGFATALMSMHIGDRWRVYIPYQLGYGTSDYSSSSTTIPGGSTLIFDITLVAYYRPGTTVSESSAKAYGASEISGWIEK